MRANIRKSSKYVLVVSILFVGLLLSSIYYSNKTKHEKGVVEKPISGAKLSFNYIGSIRSYPYNEIPKEGFSQAFQKSKHIKAKLVANWEALGPTNIGGRTLALAIHPVQPNIVFAGSASGGLWKSTTGGSGLNAWEYVRTGFPVLGVAAIAIDPQNPETMFIGTGENYGSNQSFPGIGAIRTTRGSYGIGILKSTDGGITWEKSLDWKLNQRTAVQKIQVNPKRSNTIWAATTEGTYRSYDGGDSWSKIHDVQMATDVVINPSDTSIVYTANGGLGSEGHGIYRTLNAGVSFEKMNLATKDPIMGDGPTSFQGKAVLSISKSEPNIVLASIGNSDGTIYDGDNKTWLMGTEDNGDTWTLLSAHDYSSIQGWYSHAIGINPFNPKIVWAAGQYTNIFKSWLGGSYLVNNPIKPATPTEEGELVHGYPFLSKYVDYHDIIFHPTNPSIIYFINDGGIFRTTDGGETFENCNSGYQTTQFYAGVSNSNSNQNLILGGLQDNNSVIYEGSDYWRRAWGGDGLWTALDQSNNNNAVLSAQYGNAVFSDDLFTGSDYFFAPTPEQIPQDETNFATPLILSPANNTTFFIAGEAVYTTELGNNDWELIGAQSALDGNAMSVMAGSYQNANTLYIGSMPKNSGSPRSGIFRTDNKGISWHNITQNLPDRIPTDLVVDPNDDKRIFITFGGFGTSHVFKSENGGETWLDIGSGLPDIPTWSVIVDPLYPDHIYVGNEIGVFQSQDGGETWLDISGDLPDAVFAIDLIISQSNRTLRLATHGNGFYQLPLTSSVSNQVEGSTPDSFVLHQNYPNPFNPTTTIRYQVNKNTPVKLEVFDITGKSIITLVDKVQSAGEYTVSFDGANLSSGTYIYRLETESITVSKTMLLIK